MPEGAMGTASGRIQEAYASSSYTADDSLVYPRVQASEVRTGDRAIKCRITSTNAAFAAVPVNWLATGLTGTVAGNVVLGVRFYIKFSALPSADIDIILTGGFTYSPVVLLKSDGKLALTDQTASRVAVVTTSGSYAANVWHCIRVVRDGSDGEWLFDVNGEQIGTGTSSLFVGSASADSNTFVGARSLSGLSSPVDFYYDDIMVSSAAAGSSLSSELPPMGRVKRRSITGDGAGTTWTGTYTDVDDLEGTSGYDSDTTYITSSTNNQVESVSHPSLSTDSITGVINAVRFSAVGRDISNTTNWRVGCSPVSPAGLAINWSSTAADDDSTYRFRCVVRDKAENGTDSITVAIVEDRQVAVGHAQSQARAVRVTALAYEVDYTPFDADFNQTIGAVTVTAEGEVATPRTADADITVGAATLGETVVVSFVQQAGIIELNTSGGGQQFYSSTAFYISKVQFKLRHYTEARTAYVNLRATNYWGEILAVSDTVNIPAGSSFETYSFTFSPPILTSDNSYYGLQIMPSGIIDLAGYSADGYGGGSAFSSNSSIPDWDTYFLVYSYSAYVKVGVAASATPTIGAISGSIAGSVYDLVSTIVDSFDDNSLDTSKWLTGSTGNTEVREQNKRLEIEALSSTLASAWAYSNKVVALQDSSFYVSISARAFYPRIEFGLSDTPGTEFSAKIGWQINASGNLHAVVEGSTQLIISFITEDYYWLRIRHSSSTGYVYFDSAPITASNPPIEGDWVNRYSVNTWTPSTSRLYFRARAQSVAQVLVAFDGLNGPSSNFVLADASQTVGAVTLTAAGTVSASGFNADFNKTIGAITSTAAGTVEVQAALTQSLAITPVFTAKVDVAAALTQELALSLTADGTVEALTAHADADITLGAITLSAATAVEVIASSSQTLGAISLASAANVEVGAAFAATLAQTLSAAGTVEVQAALTQTTGATLSADAAVEVTASASNTLGAITLSATGNVPAAADFSATLALTGSSSGTIEVQAALTASTSATLSSTAAVEVQADFSSTVGLTLSAAGTVGSNPANADADLTLGAVTLTSAAQVEVNAAFTATVEQTLASTGAVEVQAALTQSLALTLTSAAQVEAAAAFVSTLALTVAASAAVEVRADFSGTTSASVTSTASVDTVEAIADADLTLGAVTLTSASAVGIAAALSTELALTGTSDGTVLVSADAANTVGLTLSSTAQIEVTGSFEQTVALSLSSQAAVQVSADSSVTLSAASLASQTAVLVSADASLTIGAVSLSSTLTLSQEGTGSLPTVTLTAPEAAPSTEVAISGANEVVDVWAVEGSANATGEGSATASLPTVNVSAVQGAAASDVSVSATIGTVTLSAASAAASVDDSVTADIATAIISAASATISAEANITAANSSTTVSSISGVATAEAAVSGSLVTTSTSVVNGVATSEVSVSAAVSTVSAVAPEAVASVSVEVTATISSVLTSASEASPTTEVSVTANNSTVIVTAPAASASATGSGSAVAGIATVATQPPEASVSAGLTVSGSLNVTTIAVIDGTTSTGVTITAGTIVVSITVPDAAVSTEVSISGALPIVSLFVADGAPSAGATANGSIGSVSLAAVDASLSAEAIITGANAVVTVVPVIGDAFGGVANGLPLPVVTVTPPAYYPAKITHRKVVTWSQSKVVTQVQSKTVTRALQQSKVVTE